MQVPSLKSILRPVMNARLRHRLTTVYCRPVDFARRAYLHFEQTVFKRLRPFMLPARVKLNTGYICNLRCPLCPTGRQETRPLGHLTLQMADFLLERLRELKIVSLFCWQNRSSIRI